MKQAVLETAAIVAAGIIEGNELCVSIFHAMLRYLDERTQFEMGQKSAAVFGKIMPFWYAATFWCAATLLLSGAAAYTRPRLCVFLLVAAFVCLVLGALRGSLSTAFRQEDAACSEHQQEAETDCGGGFGNGLGNGGDAVEVNKAIAVCVGEDRAERLPIQQCSSHEAVAEQAKIAAVNVVAAVIGGCQRIKSTSLDRTGCVFRSVHDRRVILIIACGADRRNVTACDCCAADVYSMA